MTYFCNTNLNVVISLVFNLLARLFKCGLSFRGSEHTECAVGRLSDEQTLRKHMTIEDVYMGNEDGILDTQVWVFSHLLM